jgi:hypothetical protein
VRDGSANIFRRSLRQRIRCHRLRQLGVPDWALEVLKEHRAQQDRDRALFGAKYVDNNLIFCQPDGHYYSPDRLGARVVWSV